MAKRICSLVLLFSCFCSLGLFLVAHAETASFSLCYVYLSPLFSNPSIYRNGSSSAGSGRYDNTTQGETSGSVYMLGLSGGTQVIPSGAQTKIVLKFGYAADFGSSYTYFYDEPSMVIVGSSFSASDVGKTVSGIELQSWEWDSQQGTLTLLVHASEDKTVSGITYFFKNPVSRTFSNCYIYDGYHYYDVIANCTVSFNTIFEEDADNIVDAVNRQTHILDQSITDAGQGIENKIESSFDTSASAGVGSAAQDFADQASASLGVVSYVDTIFSGLSGLVVSGSTTLTFPSVTIDVEGSSYQLWPDYTFDLSELDGWLSGLMAVVRLATSAVVVGAVISYLQHVYKEVIG